MEKWREKNFLYNINAIFIITHPYFVLCGESGMIKKISIYSID